MSAYPLLQGESRSASPTPEACHASVESTCLSFELDEGNLAYLGEKSRSRRALWRSLSDLTRLPTILCPRVDRLSPWMIALLPSFVGQRVTGSVSKSNTSNIAVLDGLRGFACLFVFNNHYSNNFSWAPLDSYNGEDRALFIQLPFIRLGWAGSFMVAIFFVISGYVLSVKPLKQMRSKQPDQQILQTLSSSIIRRGLRLYLPSLADLFIVLVLAQIGAFDYSWQVLQEGASLTAIEFPPHLFPTLSEQLSDFWTEMLWLFRPFWGPIQTGPGYDVHLWTIPYEFGCSMVLFLVQCGVAPLRNTPRLIVTTSVILWCFCQRRRDTPPLLRRLPPRRHRPRRAISIHDLPVSIVVICHRPPFRVSRHRSNTSPTPTAPQPDALPRNRVILPITPPLHLHDPPPPPHSLPPPPPLPRGSLPRRLPPVPLRRNFPPFFLRLPLPLHPPHPARIPLPQTLLLPPLHRRRLRRLGLHRFRARRWEGGVNNNTQG